MKQVKLLITTPTISPGDVHPRDHFYATRLMSVTKPGTVEYKGILVQDEYQRGVYKNRILSAGFTWGNSANMGVGCQCLQSAVTELLERGWEVMECDTLAEVAKWLDV